MTTTKMGSKLSTMAFLIISVPTQRIKRLMARKRNSRKISLAKHSSCLLSGQITGVNLVSVQIIIDDWALYVSHRFNFGAILLAPFYLNSSFILTYVTVQMSAESDLNLSLTK